MDTTPATSGPLAGIEGLAGAELIGSGGSAQVFRAEQTDFSRLVAVKVLNHNDPALMRRFDRERRAMGRLSTHQGIVPVYSSGTTELGQPYLVMAYYAKGSLDDRLTAGPVPWNEAVQIMAAVSSTIAAAHDQGVLHLDLKPGNVMVADDGSPRVADFGIARLMTDTASRSTTNTSFTPSFVPPETIHGQTPTPAADIYGLGATLWALIGGHPPFHIQGGDGTNSIMALMSRVAQEPPGDLRHLAPDWVCRTIETAMAKDPAHRQPTAADLAAALAAGDAGAGPIPAAAPIAQAMTVTAPSLDPGHTVPVDVAASPSLPLGPGAAVPSAAKRGGLIVAAAILVVALFGGGVFALTRGDGTTTDDGATAADEAVATETDADADTDETVADDQQGSTTTNASAAAADSTTTLPPTSTTDGSTTTAEATTTTAPTTTTTSTTSAAPVVGGDSLAGSHGLTLQWIGWDDWGSIEFTPLGDERYEISGRQDGLDGDYVIVEGIATKVSDLELSFEGRVEMLVSFANGAQACVREGPLTFLSTQGRQYWRMQDLLNCDGIHTDYVDIYFS